MNAAPLSRRNWLGGSCAGLFGRSLAEMLALRARSASAREPTFGRAKSCIVLFAWGGMSHLDTWDPKPHAGSDIRSIFQPIATNVPEHLHGTIFRALGIDPKTTFTDFAGRPRYLCEAEPLRLG